MSSRTIPDAPYADVQTVGLPRALMYYRYAPAWEAFFEALGRTTVVSRPSDLALLERGSALSVDECCLASKLYLGHVDELASRCDAVFVPSLANLGRFRGFCTKYQALPDLVRNTFAPDTVRIVSCLVEEQQSHTSEKDAYTELALQFGVSEREAKHAFKASRHALEQAEHAAEKKLEATLDAAEHARKHAASQTEAPLVILLVAHPYVAHDPLIGGAVVETLEALGATVLFAHDFDHARAYKRSLDFSATMPWIVNRELIGAALCLHERIDGIVSVSAFPCGPDSMTSDLMARRIKGKPSLSITVDAQSGTAGLETRIESFIDILRYRGKGGYLQ